MTRTALRAARLFDGVTTHADPLVLVEDGRITEVRSGPPPADAELIDLGEATLLPGLIDTHVHLAFDASPDAVGALAARDDDAVLAAMADAAAAQLRAGVTTVRDLGDRDYLALRLRESTAGLPTIVAAGPPITSTGGHCHYLGGVAERGVRDAVREHAERGVDVIKVMASGGFLTSGTAVDGRQFTPDDLVALVDEAHRHGLPVTAHAHALEAIVDGVAAGVDGLEHCSFVDGDRVAAPAELVATIVRRRIAVGATVGIAPTSLPIAPPPELLKILPELMANLARLIREGAVVVAGTDAGIAPVKPHGVLPLGLAHLAQLGMSPAEALTAGTSTAAQVCGLGDRKGRVRPGYDADLLAVDGDPLTDVGALLRPVAVFVAGRPVVTAALS
jgi:imidazolonepropionase-like amidohydrolase